MIIVITQPFFFEGEAERIAQLLSSGTADIVHIRKPLDRADNLARLEQLVKLQRLIQALPSELYPRLVLHDCFKLAVKYNLRGIHLNSRNAQPPEGSLDFLAECRRKPYVYMSLSPIFDSISKPGYNSAFTAEQIAEARRQGLIDERVMALGGVTFDKIDDVLKMGFGGAMILGDAWK